MDTIMRKYKIILSGKKGSGKKRMHDVLVKHNEKKGKKITDEDNTSLPSKVYLAADIEISIYRVSSQKKHAKFFRALQTRMDIIGVIVLIDCSCGNANEEIIEYIELFKSKNINNMVIGLSCSRKSDCDPFLEEIMQVIENHNMIIPVFFVDVESYNDVILMVETLLSSHEN